MEMRVRDNSKLVKKPQKDSIECLVSETLSI